MFVCTILLTFKNAHTREYVDKNTVLLFLVVFALENFLVAISVQKISHSGFHILLMENFIAEKCHHNVISRLPKNLTVGNFHLWIFGCVNFHLNVQGTNKKSKHLLIS